VLKRVFYEQDVPLLTSPTASNHRKIDVRKFLQATGCPACHLTKSVNNTEGNNINSYHYIPPML